MQTIIRLSQLTMTSGKLDMITLPRFAPPIFGFPWLGTASKTRVPRETDERLREGHELPRDDSPCCGGYNEAFIVQYWTSYNPR